MSDAIPTIAEAARLIAAKQLSPVELTRACLARVHALDGELHAFLHLTEERALADARAAERAIMAGGAVRATARHSDRSQRHRRHQRDTDHLRVEIPAGQHPGYRRRLRREARRRRHGADGQIDDARIRRWRPELRPPAPPARNPWNTEHFTAGSSSGTGAAVAAGLILGGIGTDTGGSIRGPAALCGIAGIKPTYGLVSRAGVAPAAYSLDHIGPMAWTAEDCALMLQALAGHDPRDPASASRPLPDYTGLLGRGIKGLKIGVIHHFHEVDHKVSDGTQRGITAALATFRDLGAELREVQLSPLQDWAACGSLISITERAAAYEEWSRTRLGDFSERMRSR